jgi:hypothetical protein
MSVIKNNNLSGLEATIIDSLAAGIPKEAILSKISVQYNYSASIDEINKLISNKEHLISERQQEMYEEVLRSNPYQIILEAIQKLQQISNNSEKDITILKSISVLQSYLNFFVSTKSQTKVEHTITHNEQNDLNDFFNALLELESLNLITINNKKEICDMFKINADRNNMLITQEDNK